MPYRLPNLTLTNKILIILFGAIFLLQNIFHIDGYLVLSPSIFNGSIYRILTYPFVGSGIFEVVFNCLLFWLIGSDLENLWGRKKYLFLLLVGLLGSAVTYIILASFFPQMGPLFGSSGLINLLMICFAVLYPNAVFSFMFLIPIKAKYFAMIIVGIELYFGFFSPSGTSILAHLGGVAAGYLFIFQYPKFKKRGPKSRLYLIKGLKDGEENRNNDSDTPPKYWH